MIARSFQTYCYRISNVVNVSKDNLIMEEIPKDVQDNDVAGDSIREDEDVNDPDPFSG